MFTATVWTEIATLLLEDTLPYFALDKVGFKVSWADALIFVFRI